METRGMECFWFRNFSKIITDGRQRGLCHGNSQVFNDDFIYNYQKLLQSNIADLKNNAKTPYGGAITAALFLQEFVPENLNWLHFDVSAWNLTAKPGRPEGGELMGAWEIFDVRWPNFDL